jgi:hypothetical protein
MFLSKVLCQSQCSVLIADSTAAQLAFDSRKEDIIFFFTIPKTFGGFIQPPVQRAMEIPSPLQKRSYREANSSSECSAEAKSVYYYFTFYKILQH